MPDGGHQILSDAAQATKRQFRTIYVLCNEGAGSVKPGDEDVLLQLLSENGIEDAESLNGDIEHEALSKAGPDDLVIVLGGDGTARSVAEHTNPDGPILLLLPGGTLNVLPKALHGEGNWRTILAAALADGSVMRLSGGLANGSPFFVAAAFGAPTILARAREALRDGKVWKAVQRVRSFARRTLSRKIRTRCNGGQIRSAEAIGFLCPAYAGELEGQGLEAVRFKPKQMEDFLRIGVKIVTADWRNDPTIVVEHCKTATVSAKGVLPGILDGEPSNFYGAVEIEFLRRGPKVLAVKGVE